MNGVFFDQTKLFTPKKGRRYHWIKNPKFCGEIFFPQNFIDFYSVTRIMPKNTEGRLWSQKALFLLNVGRVVHFGGGVSLRKCRKRCHIVPKTSLVARIENLVRAGHEPKSSCFLGPSPDLDIC